MAKEQENSETTGADLTNGLIDIGDGVKMDTRLRIQGMLYLEEKFDKPLGKIKLSEDGRIQSMIPLFTALVIQANEGMTAEDAEKHVRLIDTKTIFSVMNEMPKMLAVPKVAQEDDAENPPEPAEEKPEPETGQ